MTTATQGLVALTPGGPITDDMLAGYYVIYSIGEEAIPLARVKKAFADHNLDGSRLPKGRRPEHVMQDACTKAQRIHVNGHKEEIRAQQIGRNKDFLMYQLTRHVHDLANRVIEHPKALRVLYSFDDSTLSFEPLDGADMTDVQSIADEIQTYYDAHQAVLPGRGLRTIIRHYIEAAGGEFIRDGAYFLTKTTPLTQNSKLRDHHGDAIDAAEFIASVRGALAQIYKTEPEFHPIPCVADEGQKAFLRRKFMENAAEDLKEFRDTCVDLVKGKDDRIRGFRRDLRDRLVSQRTEIDERRARFAEVLGDTLEELDRDMQLADKALAKFLLEAPE